MGAEEALQVISSQLGEITKLLQELLAATKPSAPPQIKTQESLRYTITITCASEAISPFHKRWAVLIRAPGRRNIERTGECEGSHIKAQAIALYAGLEATSLIDTTGCGIYINTASHALSDALRTPYVMDEELQALLENTYLDAAEDLLERIHNLRELLSSRQFVVKAISSEDNICMLMTREILEKLEKLEHSEA